ncbi:MAG: hypothetical protein JW891_10225 [Candidatus Lokiarchaeota archaeon]|nr:hypothetical protein [Candidatus Lokiarchaeota archaeon]
MEILDKFASDFKDIDEALERKETFSSSRLFKCIMGLNQTESKVLAYIINNEDASTIELTEKLELDRSSIQRALQSLSNLNIIKRDLLSMKDFAEKKKLIASKKKGYVYVYNARDVDLIKKQLKSLLEKWFRSMLNYIDKLDELCDCCGVKFK